MSQTSDDPKALFLIDEYKNIAATHDNLRDLLGKIFTNFLLLSAFPFTVAGIVFRNGGFLIFSLPQAVPASAICVVKKLVTAFQKACSVSSVE
jgi:hypothetical protein